MYIFFLFSIIFGEEKSSSFSMENYIVFSMYNYMYSLYNKDYINSSYSSFVLYIYNLNGSLYTNHFYFLKEIKYLILNSKENYSNLDLKKLNHIENIIDDNINYDGFEEFKKIIDDILKDFTFIFYNICVLDKNSINEVEKDLQLPFSQLIEKYCLFKFISRKNKKIFKNCKNCKKKIILDTLNEMKINEKKILYLPHLKRYVVLIKLKEEEEKNNKISEEFLKKIYIDYGCSIYFQKGRKYFISYIYDKVHEIICL